MKLNKTLVSALFAIGLFGLTNVNLAHADNSANDVKFEVKKYNLTGFYDKVYSEPEFRQKIVDLLKSYVGKDVTLAKIDELKGKLQELLNTRAKGLYTISVPPQKLNDGEVTLNVNFVSGKVTYGSAPGYNEENVRRSLPSVHEGLEFVAGRPFVDERELTMAVENPLKLTQVEYDIKPGQPINVHVNVAAPNGKTLRYVQVDNGGSKSYDYLRGTVGYINANLTNHDDVLAAVATTNFKSFDQYYAFAVSYSRPLYKSHQRLELTLAHTSSEVSNLFDNSLLVDTVGRGDIAMLNWSYYLPHYDWSYANQLKVQAGYTFRRLYASAKVSGEELLANGNVYYVSPLYVGLNGKVVPFRGTDLEFNVRYNWFYAGFLATSDVDKQRNLNQRRVTGEKYEDWWTGSLSFRTQLPKNWTWYQSLTAQYSNKHLVATERYSTNLRGFRDAGTSGDSGVALKTEVITPNLVENLNSSFKLYGFVDVGYAKYNRNAADRENNPGLEFKGGDGTGKAGLFSASAGIGTRYAYKQFSVDAYYARNLTKVLKKEDKENRNSVFFSAIYRF